MREIKFRAWTHQNPPMPWSQKAVAITGEGEQMLPIGGTYTGVWHAFKNAADGGLIIEQFTGLKDKNGREIYEGDIVRATYFEAHYRALKVGKKRKITGKIIYGSACFFIESISDETPLLQVGGSENIEVIGNIHENPELFGGEE